MKNERFMSPEICNLLRQLYILPEKKSKGQMAKETGELLKRLTEENPKMIFYATSGEGDPGFWNPLREKIMNAVGHGIKFFHCLGPMICTDDQGRNAIIEAYKEYPKDVEIWLNRTRNLYHWRIFAPKEISKQPFYAYAEFYHKPLVQTCKVHYISTQAPNDPFFIPKVEYFLGKMGDFEALKIIRDKVTIPENVPTLTMYQLRAAYKMAKGVGEDVNTLTKYDILKFSDSKPL